MNTNNINLEEEKDLALRELDAVCVNESHLQHPWWYNLKYTLVGILFGIVFVKAEVVSWFRIQEMFHFQSFHMFGIIGSAVLIGMISVAIIKKVQGKSIYGESIEFKDKVFNKGNIFGALIFGSGWAITGACPGPLFAQIGSGYFAVIITLISAIAGTWVYGYFRDKLPH